MSAEVRRHPVLGFFAGLCLGLGVVLILFALGVVPFSVTWLGVATLGGALLGMLVTFVAPARQRR